MKIDFIKLFLYNTVSNRLHIRDNVIWKLNTCINVDSLENLGLDSKPLTQRDCSYSVS